MRAIYLIIFAIFCVLCSSIIHYEDDGSTDWIKHGLFLVGIISAVASFVFMTAGT